MTKAEAFALFERIYNTFSRSLWPKEIHLVCTLVHGIVVKDRETWSVIVGDHQLNSPAAWESYKAFSGIIETDQDLENYADAMRTQAEIETGEP